MKNEVLDKTFVPTTEGVVRCKEELGGLIKSYYREAAQLEVYRDKRQWKTKLTTDHYRKFSWLSDWRGIKTALGAIQGTRNSATNIPQGRRFRKESGPA